MNPELVKAVRSLLRASQRASAAGVSIPDEEIEAFIREETAGRFGMNDANELLSGINTSANPATPGGARNLVRSAAQGALFNFADEAIGLFSPAAKEEMRLRQDLFQKEHPVADAVAGLAGGIGTAFVPGVGAAKVVKGAKSVGQAVKAGVKTGAIAGALGGAGAAESMSDIPEQAATGAAFGAGIGAAVPAAVGAVKLLGPSARATRRLRQGIQESGGVDAVRAANAAAGAAGRGDEAMLGNLSDELGQQLDFAANANPKTFVEANRKASQQAAGMSERVVDDVASAVGHPVAQERAQQLASETAEWAEGAYGQLREQHATLFAGPGFERKMEAILRQPKVAGALEEARATQLIGTTPELGDGFSMLQRLKIRLGSAGRAADRKGDGDLARRLFEASDYIRDELREVVPGYKAVDAQYAERIGLERALESGAEWWGKRAPVKQFEAHVRSLSDTQLAEFRTGMISEMLSELENAKTNQNAARTLVNRSKATDAKLRILFKTPEAFEKFISGIEIEADLLRRTSSASGGSPSARRLIEQGADPMQMGGEVAGSTAFGPEWAAAAVARATMRRVPRAIARRTAATLGPQLLTSGTQNIDDLLRQISDRPAVTVGPRTQAPIAALSGLLPRY
jgi:hypothetical protein